MHYAITEPKYMILEEGKSYTFSDIFNLSQSVQEIVAEFGYQFAVQQLALPRYPLPAGDFAELRQRMYENLTYIEFTSETVKREYFVAPLLWKLLDYIKFSVRMEYPLYVSEQLRGILDYWLRVDDTHMIIIEAKKDDLARGFSQLATQLIALDGHVNPKQRVLYGVVTLGDVWRFGALHRAEKKIVQDADLFNLPADIEAIAAILLGILGEHNG